MDNGVSASRLSHLNDYDGNGCGLDTRALLVGASNVWFAVRQSALAIPHQPRPVEIAVAEHWTDLETFADLEDMKGKAAVLATIPSGAWLSPEATYTLEELWDEYAEQRDGTGDDTAGPDALLGPEWVALTTPGATRHGDDFAVIDGGKPITKLEDRFGRLHLATRLCEVVAITGFTRLDAFDPTDQGPGRVRRAGLSNAKTTWAPAVQSRGEGVLVTLDEDAVQTWESNLIGLDGGRYRAMTDAQRAWRQRRGLDPNLGLVTVRFVLLHAVAHLLIKAISVSSGYATASIRERIYSRVPLAGDPMTGVLLYTAASDSEGTLGGLVSLGQPEAIGPLIDQAVEQARICSSDPFCATHLPNGHRTVPKETARCMGPLAMYACSYPRRRVITATAISTVPTWSPPSPTAPPPTCRDQRRRAQFGHSGSDCSARHRSQCTLGSA